MSGANEYHFVTRWRVPGAIGHVYELIRDVPGYTRWWPEVYLNVEKFDQGYRLLTKGRLPYTLRWESHSLGARAPESIEVEARGDFVGRGKWTLAQDGPQVNVTFDWRIRADKALIRYLSFVLKPIFEANHRWAMARGEEGLRRELERGHER